MRQKKSFVSVNLIMKLSLLLNWKISGNLHSFGVTLPPSGTLKAQQKRQHYNCILLEVQKLTDVFLLRLLPCDAFSEIKASLA